MCVQFTGHLRIPRYLAHIATCKPFLIQGLCEDISQLLFSVDVNDINIFLHDMISEKVMMNLNVLCLRVLNSIVGNLDGAFVVVVEWHLLQMNAIVFECLLHP